MPIIVLALGGMYAPVVQLNEALDFRLLLVTVTIVLIVAMIAFRRPGVDESEMTRPFDDFDNVYEKDGDLWIKSETHDGLWSVIEGKSADDYDSESLRAELEEIAEIDDAIIADREERFKNDLGEVAVAGIIAVLVAVSLGLFAVISSYGYGDKVTLAGTQTQDSSYSSSVTEDLKNVAEFTNGIVGSK